MVGRIGRHLSRLPGGIRALPAVRPPPIGPPSMLVACDPILGRLLLLLLLCVTPDVQAQSNEQASKKATSQQLQPAGDFSLPNATMTRLDWCTQCYTPHRPVVPKGAKGDKYLTKEITSIIVNMSNQDARKPPTEIEVLVYNHLLEHCYFFDDRERTDRLVQACLFDALAVRSRRLDTRSDHSNRASLAPRALEKLDQSRAEAREEAAQANAVIAEADAEVAEAQAKVAEAQAMAAEASEAQAKASEAQAKAAEALVMAAKKQSQVLQHFKETQERLKTSEEKQDDELFGYV